MFRQETCRSVTVESLLVDALKGMSALLAYNGAAVERLEAIVVNPIVRAYASYAVHEVDKVGRLLEAALIRLGARGLKVGEGGEEKLPGRALPRLMRGPQSALLGLERRVTRKPSSSPS